MKLGGKTKDVDSFVDQLKSEGQNVVEVPKKPVGGVSGGSVKAPVVPAVNMER
jgi:hypothetical protein